MGRRKGQDLFYILGGNKVAPGGASAGPTAANKAPTKLATKPSAPAGGSSAPKTGSIAAKPVIKAAGAKAIGGDDASKLQAELQDTKMNLDTAEKERDFYFGKLRDIEMFLQANEAKKTPLTENILKILYASEEEKVLIDEAGNLLITSTNGGASTGGDAGTGHDQMLNEDAAIGGDDEEMLENA